MSIKAKFTVIGSDTPLPPDIELSVIPKVGDEIKYINPERHTVSTVSRISYEIYNSEIYVIIELKETKDSRR